MKYALIKDGLVINVILWDGPGKKGENALDFGEGVDYVELSDSDAVSKGYLYDGKNFASPPLTEEEEELSEQNKINENKNTKNTLFSEATISINTLQDAVDLEMATDEESATLLSWKKYRVLLNRINADTSDDLVWPEKPV